MCKYFGPTPVAENSLKFPTLLCDLNEQAL